MESYLVDESILAEVVDALIAKKYPGRAGTEDIKKAAMKGLDHQILKSILGSLTKEEGAELNQLLKKETNDPAVFQNFFKEHNIDLEQTIRDTMVKFGEDFLKGDEDA